jgi:tetratricopeptide (TPR) repeat protein
MKGAIVFVFLLLTGINSQAQTLQFLLDSSTYYWDSEQYKEAFGVLSRGVAESKKQYEAGIGNSGSNYAYVLNQMGVRLYMAENYETAESYHNVAIPIYKTVQREDGADYLVCINNLALCYDDHGLYNESLNEYAYLLSNDTFLQSQGNGLYQTYNTAGVCGYQTGNYELAKGFYQKGLALLNVDVPDYWVLMENLLVLENSLADYIEAYKLLVPLAKQFPEKEQEYSNTIAYYSRDMGHVEFNKGNYVGSIPYFKNTLLTRRVLYMINLDVCRIKFPSLEGVGVGFIRKISFLESQTIPIGLISCWHEHLKLM